MYLLLLVLGWLLGAAGVVLAGSGMSLRDGTFDAAILTPGIVRRLAGFFWSGSALDCERSNASSEHWRHETPGEPARIPFAPKATHESVNSPTAAPGADKASPPIPAIAGVPDANVETPPSGKRNGNGTTAVRTGLRPAASLRRPSAGEREPALDVLWPKGPRPSRAVEGASAPIAQSVGVTPVRSQQNGDTPSAAVSVGNPESAAAGASVLKSGVVNSMPYTLYSDGSIEAQLPEGTLRFGSISELRNHIEQSA